jgi:hypothetical protein
LVYPYTVSKSAFHETIFAVPKEGALTLRRKRSGRQKVPQDATTTEVLVVLKEVSPEERIGKVK